MLSDKEDEKIKGKKLSNVLQKKSYPPVAKLLHNGWLYFTYFYLEFLS